ncbi:hypothetical protein INT44_008502 [Umbelopsis vinacea]|uniref:Core domain-containing protein n=1 Tax=Umbelopsis vinacea TaxID=44442 RepID=A0A8H7UHA3_9FUNG|nr:hypothetical protein INT44_008502 [Umbelopsis vinacea]
MLRTTLTSVAKRQYLHTWSTNVLRPPTPSLLRANVQHAPLFRSFSVSSVIRSQVRPAEQKNGLVISDRAIQQLKFMSDRDKDPEQMLRVMVDSGGCHGYQNKLDLTSKAEEDDIVFEKDGARVVIDEVSLQFLRGSTVDFVEELIGSTFQVVANPNAKHTCGCNISYDIDLDMITQN